MTSITGREFPLAFERKTAERETVLLGVIPIGAIERLPTGRYYFSIDLPCARQAYWAHSLHVARSMVELKLQEWFEAAGAPHREQEHRS